MVNPKILCQKHLCGMHLELHMFVGSIKKGVSMKGFIENDLLEPTSIKQCHESISNEMLRRGYNHRSLLDDKDVQYALQSLNEKYLYHKIDQQNSLNELINRCPKCKERYLNL